MKKGRTHKRFWTPEQDAVVREMYANHPTQEIADKLQRKIGSVYQRAKILGLQKSEDFVRSCGYNMCRHENSIKSRYVKGQTAWNKGIPFQSGGRSAEAHFKPGQLPKNTKWDGAITIRHDKRGVPQKHIRVGLRKWEYLSRYTWAQAYGPIPKGHCIIFIDRDTMNCELSNLACISRKENMARNTIHNYPEELRSAIRAISKLKKTIENHGNKKQND